tara:strand:- start:929 stop:1690 length:762 start_codon:yes stop_codon:yes gene_type:complete
MIVWLASYPQSGNNFVRSLLSSYIFSEDGSFDAKLLENIDLFPNNFLFQQLGVNINNEDEMYKNYINSQKIINKKDSIMFLKTHSCFINTDKFKFTDRHNTLGVIYIVRDPRNIIPLHSQDFKITEEQSLKYLLSETFLGKESQSHCTTYLGSWKNHFNSWKVFRRFNKYLLVRYEDLINETDKTFLNILKFIAHLGRVNFTLDEKKFENSLKTTEIEKMSDNEFKKFGAANKKIIENLEKELESEMKELNYL